MNGQSIINCPQCGSNRVKKHPFIGGLFIVGGLLLLIPFVGWVFGPVIMIIGYVKLSQKKRMKVEPMQCHECNHAFSASKEKYDEYQSYLKQKKIVS